VLAPDLTLADVNVLFSCEVSLVLGVHEARDETLWAVFAADHSGDHAEGFVNRFAGFGAGVVHGREVAAGDEGDLVAILVVVGREEAARIFVLLPGVDEGEPTDGPGHAAVGAASGKGFSARTNVGGAVVGSFVFADRTGWGYFDLVDSYDGDVRDESSAEGRRGWRKRHRAVCREYA
jgi:hypothetical protein